MAGTWAEVALVMFVGMGPVKVLVYYLGATRHASPALGRKVAVRAVGSATIVCLGLLVVGWLLMRLLHFSNGALIVAGGIVLLAYGIQTVLDTAPLSEGDVPPTEDALMRAALYPMGVPLILNPAGSRRPSSSRPRHRPSAASTTSSSSSASSSPSPPWTCWSCGSFDRPGHGSHRRGSSCSSRCSGSCLRPSRSSCIVIGLGQLGIIGLDALTRVPRLAGNDWPSPSDIPFERANVVRRMRGDGGPAESRRACAAGRS